MGNEPASSRPLTWPPEPLTGRYSGTAGNPQLKPYRANAVDVSYEKYWGTKAYVSAAAFYKQLSTYIIKSPSEFDFTPYITSQTAPAPSPLGVLTRPVNGSGGQVKGVEFAGSFPVAWGFGVQASYAYTESSVVLPIGGLNTENIANLTIPLPGLSKNVAQLVLYYEAHGFEARVGTRYRSNFVGSITDQYGDSRLVLIKGERITDAQISYNFDGGPLKGLSILFQANNLGNEPYTEYRSEPQDVSKRLTYGKNYLLGVNYKM